jgi:hypothetical protein
MTINLDRLNNQDRELLGKASFVILTRLQDFDQETQVHACAVLFQLICERHDLDQSEIYSIVSKMLARDYKTDGKQHFQAIRDYLKHEHG